MKKLTLVCALLLTVSISVATVNVKHLNSGGLLASPTDHPNTWLCSVCFGCCNKIENAAYTSVA